MADARSPGLSPAKLVALVCTAQVLAQIGAYTWPALLPGFLARWPISNTEAGWVTGIFYASYMLAVPVLVGLTDRVDPRRIYLLGVALTVISHAGFAWLAEGFWSALLLRALAGVGWAGTYMTGLKLLADGDHAWMVHWHNPTATSADRLAGRSPKVLPSDRRALGRPISTHSDSRSRPPGTTCPAARLRQCHAPLPAGRVVSPASARGRCARDPRNDGRAPRDTRGWPSSRGSVGGSGSGPAGTCPTPGLHRR